VQQLSVRSIQSERASAQAKLSGNQLNADQGQLSVHPQYLLAGFSAPKAEHQTKQSGAFFFARRSRAAN